MCSKTRIGMVVVLCVAVALAAGCATFSLASGIGEHKVNETSGAMSKDYPKPMKTVWDACLAACQDCSIKITDQKFDPQQSFINAIWPQRLWIPEQKVRIDLTAKGDQASTAVIRVGGEKSGNPFSESQLQSDEKDLHIQIMIRLGIPRELTPMDIWSLTP